MVQQPQIKYRQNYQPTHYTISQIELTFELDDKVTIVTAVSRVKRIGKKTESLVLDGKDILLKKLSVNGREWSNYSCIQEKLILQQLPDNFVLTIITEIHPVKNTALEGLYLSNNTLCTQCEAEGFRRITYYLDRPDILAKFRTKIIANKTRYPYLLSNGNCIEQGDLSDGRHWVVWEDPFPKPCYLFALVAGIFDSLQDIFITNSGRKVTLRFYVESGKLARAHWAMTCLKKAMRWEEIRFGLEYDLDIYMVVAVSFFNMGAMENKGLNIFNDKYVLADKKIATDSDYLAIESVIGHEYFHNWTGNRVTCRDWFQLSLKEGLTVFRDQEFSSDIGSRALQRIENIQIIRSAQFAEDASPMSHPIRPDKVIEMNNFYTVTVYEKGAEVIRMLHTILGEDDFKRGLLHYLTCNDGSAVTCDDFIDAMEVVSGLDLTQFRLWYSQSGTPRLSIRDCYDKDKQQYSLFVEQYTPATLDQAEKMPLHIPLVIELYDQQGNIIPLFSEGKSVNQVLNVTKPQQTFIFDKINALPIPALLCGFSAPVKLDYPYDDQQLIFLLHHAQDSISRWDAAQNLFGKYIRIGVSNIQNQESVIFPEHVITALKKELIAHKTEATLLAEILTIPSLNEIAELFDIIDPDAIFVARESVIRLLAKEMANEWLESYHHYSLSHYRIRHEDMGKRALCNRCLYYLAFSDSVFEAQKIVINHYQQASNMTDIFFALSVAVAAQLPCTDDLLNEFEQRWQKEPLVMDKWFALQARRPDKNIVNRIKQLMKHPSFVASNPNRVKALIGTFTAINLIAFHALDGSGYQLLTNLLMDMDKLNSHMAADLVSPLLRWKRYDKKRQKMMIQSLRKLSILPNISHNLYEKITNALVGATVN